MHIAGMNDGVDLAADEQLDGAVDMPILFCQSTLLGHAGSLNLRRQASLLLLELAKDLLVFWAEVRGSKSHVPTCRIKPFVHLGQPLFEWLGIHRFGLRLHLAVEFLGQPMDGLWIEIFVLNGRDVLANSP